MEKHYMLPSNEHFKQLKTIAEQNGEEFIFQNKQWLITRDGRNHNTLWIEWLGETYKPYGSIQSALILEDRVLYDWPEYIPAYIKRICARQKQRV